MKPTIIVLTAVTSLLGACDIPPAERTDYSKSVADASRPGPEPAPSQPGTGQSSISAEVARTVDSVPPEQRETAVNNGTTSLANPAPPSSSQRKVPPSAPRTPPKRKPGEVILPAPEQPPAEVDPPHRYPGDEVPG
jgi:hypothetical protein